VRRPAEISFRLRQETENLRLYLFPPREAPATSPLPLPSAATIEARLRDTALAAQLQKIAEGILARRIPLLGYQIETEGEIRWRRDYVHQRETPPVYFRRVPYLDFERAGDHKVVWELNRHQHLVAMAQASLFGGRADFLKELFAQLESWLDQNPVCHGINWASALEVAFRALSWMWIHHLAGDRMEPRFKSRWLLTLYHHGCYLEHNLSIYFSPNTHLQGEALALHALGMLFGVDRWRARGAALTRRMIQDHVNPDGGHFEESSYYHVYALDMFLFHAVLEPPEETYREALRRMARYLWALAGSGEMPMLGDDDGGRLFHPFGDRSRFARATLAACAAFLAAFQETTPCHGESADLDELAVWWLGDRAKTQDTLFLTNSRTPRVSASFPDTGVVTMVEGDTGIVAAARAFGPGNAGHSHAHALHFTLRHAGEEVLIDPGTYTYTSDPVWRDRFRGTAAHNTLRIDLRDQADPAGPFRWSNLPVSEILELQQQPWRLRARCRYRGLCHERQMIFSDGLLWIVDRVTGAGRHRIEQFWHPAGAVERIADDVIQLPGRIRLIMEEGREVEIEEGGDYGWRSPVPGVKLPLPVIRLSIEADLPSVIVTAFDSQRSGAPLRIEGDWLTLGDRRVRFTPD
jgi:hypothetical protein